MAQFHQRSTYSFYASRSQMGKKRQSSQQCHLALLGPKSVKALTPCHLLPRFCRNPCDIRCSMLYIFVHLKREKIRIKQMWYSSKNLNLNFQSKFLRNDSLNSILKWFFRRNNMFFHDFKISNVKIIQKLNFILITLIQNSFVISH